MNWMRFRKVYFSISSILIGIGVFSLLKWGLVLGIDFKGGTIAEYKFENSISTEEAQKIFSEKKIDVNLIQTTGEGRYLARGGDLSIEDKEKLKEVFKSQGAGNIEELRFEVVGPTIGPELVKKTIVAIVIASTAILLWIAYRFRSLKFGSAAILAMFHDTFNLIGLFSLLGHFFGAQVDFLFVTALLTTLSFSVHDTIVVYDRIRESKARIGGTLYDLANRAVTETMVRSLNNSFTIIFMLVALILLGGSTIKWFATALFIGTVLGTYSSPFVAVPLLVTFDDLAGRLKSRNFIRVSK